MSLPDLLSRRLTGYPLASLIHRNQLPPARSSAHLLIQNLEDSPGIVAAILCCNLLHHLCEFLPPGPRAQEELLLSIASFALTDRQCPRAPLSIRQLWLSLEGLPELRQVWLPPKALSLPFPPISVAHRAAPFLDLVPYPAPLRHFPSQPLSLGLRWRPSATRPPACLPASCGPLLSAHFVIVLCPPGRDHRPGVSGEHPRQPLEPF